MPDEAVFREDLLALYGFENEQEREYFNMLLGVNGVGPRLAMSVISASRLDQLKVVGPVMRERKER